MRWHLIWINKLSLNIHSTFAIYSLCIWQWLCSFADSGSCKQFVTSYKMWHVSTLNNIWDKVAWKYVTHISGASSSGSVFMSSPVRMSAVSFYVPLFLSLCVILNQDFHCNRDSSAMAVSLPLHHIFNPVVHSCQTPEGNFALFCIFWFVVLFAIYFIHMQKYIKHVELAFFSPL